MGLDIEYDDHCREKECYQCEEKDSQIKDVKYWLEAIIEHLYSLDISYVDDFEFCLDNLACSVGLKIPESKIKLPKQKIVPNQRNFDEEINWWKVMNQNHLRQL